MRHLIFGGQKFNPGKKSRNNFGKPTVPDVMTFVRLCENADDLRAAQLEASALGLFCTTTVPLDNLEYLARLLHVGVAIEFSEALPASLSHKEASKRMSVDVVRIKDGKAA